MDDIKKNIAENISSLRMANGLSQSKLAESLGYTDKAVSKWERGESVPDISVLKRIADMFGVTVDYLISKNSASVFPEEPLKKREHNRFIITLLSIMLVWLVATFIFVTGGLFLKSLDPLWLVFVAAVPISSVVALVFNSLWGKGRNNFYIITLMLWSLLAFVYLVFLENNLWLIFLIGVPSQLIIVLWSRLKSSPRWIKEKIFKNKRREK